MSVSRMLRSVFQHARGERVAAALLLVVTLAQVAYGLVVPLSYQVLFDEVVPQLDVGRLVRVALFLAGAFVTLAVASFFAEKIASKAGTRVANSIRESLFQHIQKVASSNHEAGDLLARFATDISVIETSVIRSLPLLLLHLLSLLLSVTLLFWVEWHLALVTLAALPIVFILPQRLEPRATASSYERKQHEAVVTGTVNEAVGHHEVVRAFALERPRLRLFQSQLRALGKASDSASLFGSLVGRSAKVGVEAVQILVVIVGCWLVISGFFTAGALIAFVGLLLNVGAAADGLSLLAPPFLQATGSMQRIEELLSEPPILCEAPEAEPLERFYDQIQLDGVTLRFGQNTVVDNVSLSISAGQSVALVGTSGSGKSTLLNLIMRFIDPSEGRVTMDGVDIAKANLDALRSQFGVVLQDASLFNTSVRENLLQGKLDATDRELEDAARAAELHKTVLAMEHGYDTQVGDRGSRMSGGQRQRVAIARAILRDPAILMLDEPTSALDPATAGAVEATLRSLEPGRTTIHVTHRLESAKHADVIFLLEKGKLVEHGSHDHLLSIRGHYYELWHKQSGLAVSTDGGGARIDPERLRLIPLFEDLPDSLLTKLATWFDSERTPADRMVVVEGDVGDKLFVLAHGTAEVLRDSPDGTELLGVFQVGDVFGETALLKDLPRNASVRTRGDCVFLTLSRRNFHRLLQESPEVRESFEQIAEERKPT